MAMIPSNSVLTPGQVVPFGSSVKLTPITSNVTGVIRSNGVFSWSVGSSITSLSCKMARGNMEDERVCTMVNNFINTYVDQKCLRRDANGLVVVEGLMQSHLAKALQQAMMITNSLMIVCVVEIFNIFLQGNPEQQVFCEFIKNIPRNQRLCILYLVEEQLVKNGLLSKAVLLTEKAWTKYHNIILLLKPIVACLDSALPEENLDERINVAFVLTTMIQQKNEKNCSLIGIYNFCVLHNKHAEARQALVFMDWKYRNMVFSKEKEVGELPKGRQQVFKFHEWKAPVKK